MLPNTNTSNPDNPKIANVISNPTKEEIKPANVGAINKDTPM